jgi:hypothetical protein
MSIGNDDYDDSSESDTNEVSFEAFIKSEQEKTKVILIITII